MTENENNNQRSILVSMLAIAVLIAMVAGVTYAAFNYVGIGSKENVITSGTIDFIYSEKSNGISITNAMPTSDEMGKVIAQRENDIEQGYFDFTVGATIRGTATVNYEVYGEDITDDEHKLEGRYVKVYLTDGEDENPMPGYDGALVPNYESLQTASSDPKGKKIYDGRFTGTGTQTFRLRLWVSEDYSVSGNENRFKMLVHVKATA